MDGQVVLDHSNWRRSRMSAKASFYFKFTDPSQTNEAELSRVETGGRLLLAPPGMPLDLREAAG